MLIVGESPGINPMAQLKITSIVFDLDCDEPDMTDADRSVLQKELQCRYIDKVYEIGTNLDDEDLDEVEEEIVDNISDECGWCVLSLKVMKNRE
jgi:hypothetical protein